MEIYRLREGILNFRVRDVAASVVATDGFLNWISPSMRESLSYHASFCRAGRLVRPTAPLLEQAFIVVVKS